MADKRGKRATTDSIWIKVTGFIKKLDLKWRIAGGAGIVVLIALIILMIVLLSKCSGPATPQTPSPTPVETATPGPSPSPTPSPTATPESTPEPTPDLSVTGMYNPLTGLYVESYIENARPVAIMLNNFKRALPMYGNSQADIIYEALVEGGITRMLGVYQDPTGVPNIGTVRSARPYYLDMAQGLDAIYVHAGYSDEAKREIANRGITAINGLTGWESIMFWRDENRRKEVGLEHSLFTTGPQIKKVLESGDIRATHNSGYEEPLSFTDTPEMKNSVTAESISVKFSAGKTGTFEYDAETGLYTVGQHGTLFIDGETNEAVTTTNVLVIKTSVREIDSEGRLKVTMTGSGEGFYATGGKIINMTWSKDSPEKPFVYKDEDGNVISFARGRSYVNIVPTNALVIFK